MAIIATPTASAATQTPGPKSLAARSPTAVEIRWPPIKARGCAGSAFGEPITSTIEVANGIATSGYSVRVEKISIAAIAAVPPAAPASTAHNLARSIMRRTMQQPDRSGETQCRMHQKLRAAALRPPPVLERGLCDLLDVGVDR